MSKLINKLIVKDVSCFEAYEDWWNYEFNVKYLLYKNQEININCWCSIEDLLTAVLDTLKIPYREESEEEQLNFPKLCYEKYLVSLLEHNNFEVLFEAHDDLIKYETKGIVSAINPKYKKLSKIDDFIFAEDISYNFLHDVFKGIKVDSILSYIKISSVKNHNCSVLSDKILQNILNTYGTTLSFYKLLYDAINTNIIGENNDRTN